MMARAKTETKKKTIHYRRATFLQNEIADLQSALRQALSAHSHVGDRMEDLNVPDEKTYRFINRNRNELGMTFGSLMVYSEGTNRPLVVVDKRKQELDVEQIAPPSTGGQRREFLESIMYFGIKGNHVVILQSSTLTSRHMEAYLMWLLANANVISEEDGVFLNDFIPKATQRKIRKSHAKKVRIGTPLRSEPIGDHRSKSVESAKKVRFRPAGRAFDILKSVLGDEWAKELSLTEALDESRLNVQIEVSYKYKTTEKSQKFLDDIATSLRHIDEDDVVIDLKEHGRIKGGELKLSQSIPVQTHGGIVDESDLYPRMYQWLTDCLEQNLIDA